MPTSSKISQDNRTLKKTVSKARAISLIIGSVLGSGLMILPGLTFKEVGVYSFYSWLAMGVFILPLLHIFVKTTIQLPSAGGMVNVINHVLGTRISIGISYLIMFSMVVLVPVVAIIGANYIGYLFGLSQQTIIMVAGLMLVASTLINIVNTNLVLKVQGISASLLLILLFAVIGTSSKIAMTPFVDQLIMIDYSNTDTYKTIGKGMILVFWAFLGWENLSFTSEEFMDIQKDFPKATITSYLIMMILYLGLSLSVIGTLSPTSAGTVQAPLAEVISVTFGNAYGKLVAVIGILIMIINLNAWVWGPSRLLYDCGRKKIFPVFFGSLSKYSTPVISLTSLLVLYLVILGYMLFNQTFILDVLIKIVNVSFMVLYLFVIIAFLKISKNRTDKLMGLWGFALTIFVLSLYKSYNLIPLLFLTLGIFKFKNSFEFKKEVI